MRDGKVCCGDFFIRWWNPEEEWFWPFEPFSRQKTIFCKFWTSAKIKSRITFEKLVKEQWLQLKMNFYCVITWKLLFSGGNWPLGGGRLVGKKRFQAGGCVCGRFQAGGILEVSLPPVKRTLNNFLLTFKIMLIDNDIKSCALPEAFLEKKMTKKYETPKNYLP